MRGHRPPPSRTDWDTRDSSTKEHTHHATACGLISLQRDSDKLYRGAAAATYRPSPRAHCLVCARLVTRSVDARRQIR